MSSEKPVYQLLIECIASRDISCVVKILTETPFGDLVLRELEKRGFKREEVLSAVARGYLETLSLVQKLGVELVVKASALSDLIREKKYMDAVKLIVSYPSVVDVFRAVGVSVSLEDLLFYLVYNLIESGVSVSEIKSVLGGYGSVADRALAMYRFNMFVSLVRGEKYLDALKLLVSSPEIVDFYNSVSGEKLSVKDLVFYLAFKLISSGVDRKVVESAVGGFVDEYRRALNYYLLMKLQEYMSANDYVNALKLLVSSPEVVDFYNSLSGSKLSVGDFVSFLSYKLLSSGSKPEEVLGLCGGYRDAFARAFQVFLYEGVSRLVDEFKFDKALDLVESNIPMISSLDLNRFAGDLVLFIASRLAESEGARVPVVGAGAGARVAEEVVSGWSAFYYERIYKLLDKLGVLPRDKIEMARREALELAEKAVSAMYGAVINEINEAVKSGDLARLRVLRERFGDFLSKTPLVVDSTVSEYNLASYLDYLIDYLSVKSSIDELFNILSSLSSLAGNVSANADAILSAVSRARGAMSSVERARLSMAHLRRISSLSSANPISFEEALSQIDSSIASWKRSLDLYEVVASLSKSYDKSMMDRLYNMAFSDRSLFPVYMHFYLAYEMTGDDAINIVKGMGGIGGAPSPSQSLSRAMSLGDVYSFVKSRGEYGRFVVLKGYKLLMDSGRYKDAMVLVYDASSLGIDSEVSKIKSLYDKMFRVSDIVGMVTSSVNSALEKVNLVLSSAGATASQYDSALNAVQGAQADVAKAVVSLMALASDPGLSASTTSDGRSLKAVIEDYISYLNGISGALSAVATVLRTNLYVMSFLESYSGAREISPDVYLSALNSVIAGLNDAISAVDAIADVRVKKSFEGFRSGLVKARERLSQRAFVVSVSRTIDSLAREVLEKLSEGVSVDEIDKVITPRWNSIVYSLLALKKLSSETDDKDLKDLLENHIIPNYINYLSQLKTALVHSDIRLEDFFNKAEDVYSFRIPYEKPYYESFPAEKIIKIGIEMAREQISKIPVIGKQLASFVKGFMYTVAMLVMPYEVVSYIRFVAGGAQEFFKRISVGDVAGSFSVISTPIVEAVTRDPWQFLGAVAGTVVMFGLTKAFRVPASLRAFVVDLMLADPVGLAVDLLVDARILRSVPVFRVVFDGRAGAGVVLAERLSPRALELVAPKLTGILSSLSVLADFVKAFKDDVKATLAVVNSIIEGKTPVVARLAVNLELARIGALSREASVLRESLAGLSKSVDPSRVSAIVSAIDPSARVSGVFREVAVRVREVAPEVDKLVKVSRELESVSEKIQNVLSLLESKGVRVSVEYLRALDVSRVKAVSEALESVVREISGVVEKLRDVADLSVKRFRELNLVTSADEKVLDELFRSLSMGSYESVPKIFDVLFRTVFERDPVKASAVFREVVGRLREAGLSDLAKSLESYVGKVDSIAKVIDEYVARRAGEVLEKASKAEELAGAVSLLKEISSARDVGAIVRYLSDLSSSLKKLVDVVKTVDRAEIVLGVVKSVREMVESLRKSLSDLSFSTTSLGRFIEDLSNVEKMLTDVEKSLTGKIEAIEKASRGEFSKILSEMGFSDLARAFERGEIGFEDAVKSVRDMLGRMYIKDALSALDTLSRALERVGRDPSLLTVRMAVMNIREYFTANVAGFLVEPALFRDFVSLINRARERLGDRFPRDVLDRFNSLVARGSASISDVVDIIERLSRDPVLASSLDLALAKSVIGRVVEVLKDFGSKTGFPDSVKSILSRAEGVGKSIAEFESRVVVGLVDPRLKEVFLGYVSSLKRYYPLLSRVIDSFAGDIVRFIDALNAGDVDTAVSLANKVKAFSSALLSLNLPLDIASSIKKFFADLRDAVSQKLRLATPEEVALSKAVKSMSDVISDVVDRVGKFAPGDFGFLSADLSEYAGYAVRTSIDLVPRVRELFSPREFAFKAVVEGHEVEVFRRGSITPSDVRLSYRIKAVDGEFSAEIIARGERLPDGRYINRVFSYIYYDPRALGSVSRRVASALKDLSPEEVLRRLDPEGFELLSRTVVETASGAEALSRLVGRALLSLVTAVYSSSLFVSKVVYDKSLPPEEKLRVLRVFLFSQSPVERLLTLIEGSLSVVPPEIDSMLREVGLIPVSYVRADNVQLVVSLVRDLDKVPVERLVELRLGDVSVIGVEYKGVYVIPLPLPGRDVSLRNIDVGSIKLVVEDLKEDLKRVSVPTTPVRLLPETVTLTQLDLRGLFMPSEAVAPARVVPAGLPPPMVQPPTPREPGVPRPGESRGLLVALAVGTGRGERERLRI